MPSPPVGLKGNTLEVNFKNEILVVLKGNLETELGVLLFCH